jgi:hypothetical protein
MAGALVGDRRRSSLRRLPLLGCDDDGAGPPAQNITGTWELITVHGKPLPITVGPHQPTSGELVLAPAGTWRISLHLHYSDSALEERTGTWTHSGSAVMFYENGTLWDTATLSGTTLTIPNVVDPMVFQQAPGR